ncbi:MAG TPA: S41 family peptidase [Synergistales bacterium]|nr:S41 family peptidase [Synergistales bacterium]
MFRRARDIFIGAVVGALLVGGVLSAVAFNEMDLFKSAPFSFQNLWLMKQARVILETYHVDGEEHISETELLHGAIKGMVSSLKDPYTRFVDPDELKEEEIELQGEYGGLGIYIGQRDGKTLVVSPIEDTPADRAGLKPKDQIVKIDDEVILGWPQNEVVHALRGEPGTKVVIWIRREAEDELLKFEIERESIKIQTVKSELLEDKAGLVRITQFNLKTLPDFRKAVHDLSEQGADGLLIDLRNNPGGLLNSCVEIADLLLDDGVIVSTRGRFDRANEVYYARKGTITGLPIVVLINEGSASASEILAGALKDHGRAVIVGKQSFGKGSVQTLFNLSDSSGIFVTIAKYYTPAGTVIDKVGLSPDIEVEGEFVKDRENDAQLKRAIEELKGLIDGTKKKSS